MLGNHSLYLQKQFIFRRTAQRAVENDEFGPSAMALADTLTRLPHPQQEAKVPRKRCRSTLGGMPSGVGQHQAHGHSSGQTGRNDCLNAEKRSFIARQWLRLRISGRGAPKIGRFRRSNCVEI